MCRSLSNATVSIRKSSILYSDFINSKSLKNSNFYQSILVCVFLMENICHQFSFLLTHTNFWVLIGISSCEIQI